MVNASVFILVQYMMKTVSPDVNVTSCTCARTQVPPPSTRSLSRPLLVIRPPSEPVGGSDAVEAGLGDRASAPPWLVDALRWMYRDVPFGCLRSRSTAC